MNRLKNFPYACSVIFLQQVSLLLWWIEARIALRGARAVWFRVEPLGAFLDVSSRVSGAIRAPGVSRADPGPPSARLPGVSFF